MIYFVSAENELEYLQNYSSWIQEDEIYERPIIYPNEENNYLETPNQNNSVYKNELYKANVKVNNHKTVYNKSKQKTTKINKTFNIPQNRKMYSLPKTSRLYEFKKRERKILLDS